MTPRRAAILLAALVLVPVSMAMAPAGASGAPGGANLLIDYGDGGHEWHTAAGATCLDAVSGCAEVSYGASLTINGRGPVSVRGETEVAVDWKIYSWDGSAWSFVSSDPAEPFAGTMALGLFPYPGMAPAATPDNPTAWTQYGGSSGSYNVSGSHGPPSAATPVEWYRTHTTGFVNSGIVAADGLLYHTTGGAVGAKGPDGDPWVYCLDGGTGVPKWKYHCRKGVGYEVTTPIVAGGYLVVATTCGDVLVLDRFSGTPTDRVEVPYEPPLDAEGDVAWDGHVFVTGATTPVYDSGCVFFGSADGRVYCHALSADGKLAPVWRYEPPATFGEGGYTGTRGCFYYHAPVIADVGGARTLFIGNYDGYVHALDVATGDPVWVTRAVDMRADNANKGMPGSAAAIAVAPGAGAMLVTCTDGGLFSLDGYLLALDPATGEAAAGAEGRLDGLFTSPVAAADGFYAYATPVAKGSKKLTKADGTEIDFIDAVYKFDWDGRVVWASRGYQMVKAPLTLAGGTLYAMDYSAGAFWPTGGGLTAIDAGDGSETWRVRLSPYSADSYSMVQPTVVDGRVYVGNDLGTVYCLSGKAGPGTEEEEYDALVTKGFRHWSWLVVIGVATASMLALIRFY